MGRKTGKREKGRGRGKGKREKEKGGRGMAKRFANDITAVGKERAFRKGYFERKGFFGPFGAIVSQRFISPKFLNIM